MHILLIVQPRMINLQFALYSLLAIRLANSSQCQICIYVRKYLRKENYSIALCHLHLGTFSLHHVFIAGLKYFAVCCNVRFNLRKNDTVQRLCDDGNINAQPARAAASVSKYGLRMKVVLKPESHQSNRNRNRSPCIYAANKSIHIQFCCCCGCAQLGASSRHTTSSKQPALPSSRCCYMRLFISEARMLCGALFGSPRICNQRSLAVDRPN